MTEQAGVYRVDLYENIGIVLVKDEAGEVQSVINSGQLYTANACDNIAITYTDEFTQQRGGRYGHTHKIAFTVHDFDTYDELNSLNSVFGYIPVLYFNDGTQKIIDTPVIYGSADYDEKLSSFFVLEFQNEITTFEKLQEVSGVPPVWILEFNSWADPGYWIDTGTTWND